MWNDEVLRQHWSHQWGRVRRLRGNLVRSAALYAAATVPMAGFLGVIGNASGVEIGILGVCFGVAVASGIGGAVVRQRLARWPINPWAPPGVLTLVAQIAFGLGLVIALMVWLAVVVEIVLGMALGYL